MWVVRIKKLVKLNKLFHLLRREIPKWKNCLIIKL